MTTEILDFQQLYDLAKAQALLDSDSISDLSFSPGYMFDTEAAMAAALAEEVQRIALVLHAKHFFSQAEGDDLDTLAKDHLGLDRNPGSSATGTERFSRASAAFGNVSIPAGTILETADGTQFVTVTAPLLTGLQIDATVAAVVPGSRGIVAADTIQIINSTTALLDSSITVTNPEKTAGGQERETDADFRQRILDYLSTLRRGTLFAIVTGAKFSGAIADASVDESAYPPTCYIADSAGGSNAALEVAVAAELDNWRAAGIQVNVSGAVIVTQPVDVSLTFSTGFDTSEVRDLVEAAVIAAVADTAIGATLYRSAIVAAALGVPGVINCVVVDPAGDVTPAANELLRAGTVTFS